MEICPIPKTKKNRWFFIVLSFLQQYVLGISIYKELSNFDTTKLGKKVLVIANHPGYMDFLALGWFHTKYFKSTHEPIFVTLKKFEDFPLIGKYLQKSPHFTLYPKIPQEELQELVQYLDQYPVPFVLYLLPEGTTYQEIQIEKSKSTFFGKSIRHLLIPKFRAFQVFLPIMDSVLDLTLKYKGAKAPYCLPCFYGNYPFSLHIDIQDVSSQFQNIENCCNELQQLWLSKDSRIENWLVANKINSTYLENRFSMSHNWVNIGIIFVYNFFPILSLLFFHPVFWIIIHLNWIFFLEYWLWGRHFFLHLITFCILICFLLSKNNPI